MSAVPESTAPCSSPGTFLRADDWELDDELYAAERLIRSATAAAGPSAPAWRPLEAAARTRPPETRREKPPSRAPALVAWSVLSLSLMTFVCGGVLLGWSVIADRDELWRLGMPLTLLGQAGLVLGLVLQLEGLWRRDEETAQSLDQLDEQLGELRRAATLLSTNRSPPAQSFYAHLAEGANPHLLLTDLKGQLDLLAEQLERPRR